MHGTDAQMPLGPRHTLHSTHPHIHASHHSLLPQATLLLLKDSRSPVRGKAFLLQVHPLHDSDKFIPKHNSFINTSQQNSSSSTYLCAPHILQHPRPGKHQGKEDCDAFIDQSYATQIPHRLTAARTQQIDAHTENKWEVSLPPSSNLRSFGSSLRMVNR